MNDMSATLEVVGRKPVKELGVGAFQEPREGNRPETENRLFNRGMYPRVEIHRALNQKQIAEKKTQKIPAMGVKGR